MPGDEEKQQLLAPGRINYSSVNGLGETCQDGEAPENYRQRWRSIRLLYFTLFLSSVQFAIVMSSLWPYLQEVEPGISETFLGWTNSGFSFCQILGSIAFGIWCHRRPAIEPLVFSLILMIIGSLLYSYAQAFIVLGPYVILIGRMLLGFSAGNTAVCRAVVSQSTTLSERTSAFGNTAIAQAVGFVFGPAMQVAVVPFGNQGVYIKPLKLSLNIYTAPGIVGFILGLINLATLVCYFRERKVDIYVGGDIKKPVGILPKPDLKAIAVASILFFVFLCVFALNETILTPLMMDEFAFTSSQAVLYGAILLAVSGIMSVACFRLVSILANRYGERAVLIAGLLVLLVGFTIYLPWGNEHPVLQRTYRNMTSNTVTTSAGCPVKYKWCHDTPKIYLPQFLTGASLISIGYALGFLVINTIYSKILGPRQQGTYMAWITAVGSFARVLGPMLVSRAYVSIGPRWMFLVVDGILTFAILLFGIYRHHLIPFHEYIRNIDSC